MITQTGNFQKFEFQTLAGILSDTGRRNQTKSWVTVKITVRARLGTVAMLLDDATVEPSTLSPVCPSSSTPAPPAWYWTSGAPPRSTTPERAAAGNRWRRRTAADPARRRQDLLPLRRALAVERSSLQRRWAPAVLRKTMNASRWILIGR
jgi:hypothetical protein